MKTIFTAAVLLALGLLVSCDSESATQKQLNKDGVAETTAGALPSDVGSGKRVVVARQPALTKVITEIVVEELIAAGIEPDKIDRGQLEQRVQASFKRQMEVLRAPDTSADATDDR